jgi:hypothetical protein
MPAHGLRRSAVFVAALPTWDLHFFVVWGLELGISLGLDAWSLVLRSGRLPVAQPSTGSPKEG